MAKDDKRPTDKERERIRVVALSLGYYDHLRRREGDVFTLTPKVITVMTVDGAGNHKKVFDEKGKPKTRIQTAEEQFSPRWMERVEMKAKDTISTSKQALQKKHDEILREKMGLPEPGDEGADDDAGDAGDGTDVL